jgi:hypothetical protein
MRHSAMIRSSLDHREAVGKVPGQWARCHGYGRWHVVEGAVNQFPHWDERDDEESDAEAKRGKVDQPAQAEQRYLQRREQVDADLHIQREPSAQSLAADMARCYAALHTVRPVRRPHRSHRDESLWELVVRCEHENDALPEPCLHDALVPDVRKYAIDGACQRTWEQHWADAID